MQKCNSRKGREESAKTAEIFVLETRHQNDGETEQNDGETERALCVFYVIGLLSKPVSDGYSERNQKKNSSRLSNCAGPGHYCAVKHTFKNL